MCVLCTKLAISIVLLPYAERNAKKVKRDNGMLRVGTSVFFFRLCAIVQIPYPIVIN